MKAIKYIKGATGKCPKCNSSKIEIYINVKKSYYGTKKMKDFSWKKFFVKTETSSGHYRFDYKIGSIVKSVCKNFDDPRKSPQRIKIKVAKLFEDGKGKLDTKFNQMFCQNCGYYEFYENATYTDVLIQK